MTVWSKKRIPRTPNTQSNHFSLGKHAHFMIYDGAQILMCTTLVTVMTLWVYYILFPACPTRPVTPC